MKIFYGVFNPRMVLNISTALFIAFIAFAFAYYEQSPFRYAFFLIGIFVLFMAYSIFYNYRNVVAVYDTHLAIPKTLLPNNTTHIYYSHIYGFSVFFNIAFDDIKKVNRAKLPKVGGPELKYATDPEKTVCIELKNKKSDFDIDRVYVSLKHPEEFVKYLTAKSIKT